MIKKKIAVGYHSEKLSREQIITRIKSEFKKQFPKATIINNVDLDLIHSNGYEAIILYTEDD